MEIFTSNKCTPATYALAIISVFGLQVLDWDPLIVKESFQDYFQVKLSQRAFNKLQAGLTMLGTDAFQATIQGFLMCTAACANKPITQGQIPFVSLKDACWAFYLYQQLLGQKLQDVAPQIDIYIQQLMRLQGITKLPQFMSCIQLDSSILQKAQIQLASDQALFSSYNIRQQNTVVQLQSYVDALRQEQVAQLQELQRSPKIVKIRYKNS